MKGKRVGRVGPCSCRVGSRIRAMHDGLERRQAEASKLRPHKAADDGAHHMAVDVLATAPLARCPVAESSRVVLQLQAELEAAGAAAAARGRAGSRLIRAPAM